MVADDPSMRMGWRWLSVSDKRFKPAMYVHDQAYTRGSAAQESGMTRKEVDDILLTMMLLAARDDDPLYEWAARRRAFFYYRVVRLAGAFLWEGK